MPNLDQRRPVPCRMVELEWDRGHDEFEAIVRAQTAAGIIVTEVHDLVATEGRFNGDTLESVIDEIIGVDWGTDYLTALTELAGTPPDRFDGRGS